MKYMDIKDFREQGYLQEVNRLFFHRLGLALEVTLAPDGTEYISGVWDERDSTSGITYLPPAPDKEKADRIEAALRIFGSARKKELGYDIQPPVCHAFPGWRCYRDPGHEGNCRFKFVGLR